MNPVQLFNPAGLCDPAPNGYSQGAVAPAGVRLVLEGMLVDVEAAAALPG